MAYLSRNMSCLSAHAIKFGCFSNNLLSVNSATKNVLRVAQFSVCSIAVHHKNILLKQQLFSSVIVGIKQLSGNVKIQSASKRIQRRKLTAEESTSSDDNSSVVWHVSAYATCEEYNLERIKDELVNQNVYKPIESLDDPVVKGGADVLHAVANYQISSEPRHIYFFREGSVVFWNTPELECHSVLDFLKRYEIGSYRRDLILNEREVMNYSYLITSKKSHVIGNNFCLSSGQGRSDKEIELDKFTFSNAISLSVKLAIWEASLGKYIDSIEYVVEDLKCGKSLRISRKEVMRKTGELFALRHSINLSSDLLDVPDFYWESDDLETLYLQLCSYFSIPRRTRVMNEKLNHCMELVELLTSHLSDRHHVRLEWMIIVLIMIEVVIEVLHARH